MTYFYATFSTTKMTLTWWVSKLAIDEMSFSCDQKVPNLLPSVNLVVLPKLILACKEFGDRRRHLQQLHFDIGLICDGTARHPHAASRTLLEYLLFKPWTALQEGGRRFR